MNRAWWDMREWRLPSPKLTQVLSPASRKVPWVLPKCGARGIRKPLGCPSQGSCSLNLAETEGAAGPADAPGGPRTSPVALAEMPARSPPVRLKAKERFSS